MEDRYDRHDDGVTMEDIDTLPGHLIMTINDNTHHLWFQTATEADAFILDIGALVSQADGFDADATGWSKVTVPDGEQ